MKEVMEEKGYYCLHISKCCMLFGHVLKTDPKKGYFMSSYRPNTTVGNGAPHWHSHDFHNKCISDVTKISKELYESVLEIRRKRYELSHSFRLD